MNRRIVVAALAAGVATTGLGLAVTFAGGDAPTPSTQSGSVLTGKSGKAGRVLAVKIDNVEAARPATGLDKAAIVYAIQVEGGLSRLMAVYDDNHPVPPVVGPVRSARETDLQILPQYGHPNLAYSGAQSVLKPVLEADPGIGTVADGFFRSGARSAPHNEYLRTGGAFAGAGFADDVGFRFGPAPDGGVNTPVFRARFPAARFSFTWENGRWAVWMDGYKTPWKTDNVIVQDVQVRESRFKSRTGYVPYSETVGEGVGTALRDGKAFGVTWERPSEDRGTVFKTLKGQRYNHKKGSSWIVLK